MQFILLIHTDTEKWASYDDETRVAITTQHREAAMRMAGGGKLLDAGRLYGAETSRLVASEGGELLVRDGPFAETKEQIGGYYVVQCESMEEACELAALIPTGEHGVVEVRRLYE